MPVSGCCLRMFWKEISIWTAGLREKGVSSAMQTGFTQSAEGLNTTEGRSRMPPFYFCLWAQAGTWFSPAPGLDLPPVAPSSLTFHQNCTISSQTASWVDFLASICMTQLLRLYVLLSPICSLAPENPGGGSCITEQKTWENRFSPSTM